MSQAWSDGPTSDFARWERDMRVYPNGCGDPCCGGVCGPRGNERPDHPFEGIGADFDCDCDRCGRPASEHPDAPYDWQADDGSGLTVDDDEPGMLARGMFYAAMFQLAAVAAVAGAVFAGFSVVRWLVGA